MFPTHEKGRDLSSNLERFKKRRGCASFFSSQRKLAHIKTPSERVAANDFGVRYLRFGVRWCRVG
ncbi:MAG: hypothetical protein DME88_12560 [Verrucomicrobia bacterium]|nr:MAG: hypothetical protein DME88_12560 [Verrucomicrobiota bacterium]